VNDTPGVLFLCIHNAGRSQMAAGWLHHLGGGSVRVHSAGSEPAESVYPVAVEALGEVGIDISGAEGSPVRAAAPGRIVYAGSGLRGYGLLLIVKHDETYLSAYAHNRLLLVSEGDEVGKGQVVAEMGSSGAKSTRVHFEIRQDGKPIDPLKYLPAR